MSLSYDLTCFIISLLIITLVLGAGLTSIPNKDSINKVDCFDNNRNKIIGQVCEEHLVGLDERYKIIIFVSGELTFIIVLSLIYLLKHVIYWRYK